MPLAALTMSFGTAMTLHQSNTTAASLLQKENIMFERVKKPSPLARARKRKLAQVSRALPRFSAHCDMSTERGADNARREIARYTMHQEPHDKIGVAQEYADRATDEIIEVIDALTNALQNAVLAMMYYRPAKGAEPYQARKKLELVKGHLYHALRQLDR
jgi:hypothetical protein